MIPLWKENNDLGVLITMPEAGDAVLCAAQAIAALAALRQFDFARNHELSQAAGSSLSDPFDGPVS